MAEKSKDAKRIERELRYIDLLKNAGLSEKEGAVFEVLLEAGEQGAGEIIAKTGLKRGDAYNHIYSLKNKGFLEEKTVNGRLKFSLTHPSKIESYLEEEFNRLQATRRELSGILPNLISTYNLSYHRPGVKVFEGREGLEKMMRDSLTAKSEIYSIVDPEAVDRYIALDNRKYLHSREKLGIRKKIIAPDTPYSQKRYQNWAQGTTEVRLSKALQKGFATSLQIYDNKVLYQVLKEEAMVGIIIEDLFIARLEKNVFEALWGLSRPL